METKMETKLDFTYLDSFVSEAEEKEIISFIDSQPWNTSLSRRTQHYGYEYSYNSGSVGKVKPIPKIFEGILEKLKVYFGGSPDRGTSIPDQLIINEYIPGQGIAPHVDHTRNFGPVVVSISLLSDICMEFRKEDEKQVKVLKRGSLLVLQGESRYKWKHGIPPRKTDVIDGKRVNRKRRVSLTFRTVKK